MELPPLIRAMTRPSFYPRRPAKVELVQTHISWVFLAGPLVYKVKKPVDFGFLDFTTLARRRLDCRREVRLNRRLAPDVYLGVAAIREAPGGWRLGGRGRPEEYAVLMRRVPDGALLARRLETGSVSPGMMRSLARFLVRFHAGAATGRGVSKWGSPAALRRDNEEDFRQEAAYVGRTMSRGDYLLVEDYARGFLRRRKTLLIRRVRGKRIREGHGDLHAEHVGWRGGRPFAMDCAEFTPRFRCGDVAAEVAFLAMDLESRGAWGLAASFLAEYLRASGDEEIRPLLDFYLCYRAYIRGKVNSFALDDAREPRRAREEAGRRARGYFRLAAAYARRDRAPFLAVTTGLVGTGKSTLAGLLRDRLGFAVVRSDELRKKLAGMSPTARAAEPYGGGIYAPGMTGRTYAALLAEGRKLLAAGRDVVLDAAFPREESRRKAGDLARSLGARFRLLQTACPPAEARRRLELRMRERSRVSDGRWEIYRKQRYDFEPPVGYPGDEHAVVNTGLGTERVWAALMRGLYPLRPVSPPC